MRITKKLRDSYLVVAGFFDIEGAATPSPTLAVKRIAQRSSVPVSYPAKSRTRSVHVPAAGCPASDSNVDVVSLV
jgi:hypothetical protein